MLTSKQVTDVAKELCIQLRDAIRVKAEGQPPKIPDNKYQLGLDPVDVETALKVALRTAHVEIGEWPDGAPQPDC